MNCASIQPHRRWPLLCVLIFQTVRVSPLPAQAPAPAEGLRMTVVEGEGVMNNTRQRRPIPLTVLVTNAAGAPVARAMVSFNVVEQGPAGTFVGATRSATVPTNEQGRASVRFQPNDVPGKIEIRINVTHETQSARATITQFNMAVPDADPATQAKKKSGHGKLVALVAVAGAAAAGAIVAGTRTKPGPTPPAPGGPPVQTLVIVPGSGSVGPPQ